MKGCGTCRRERRKYSRCYSGVQLFRWGTGGNIIIGDHVVGGAGITGCCSIAIECGEECLCHLKRPPQLCAVADLARRLSTEHDPFGLMPLLNNRLIPSGVRPIGLEKHFGASLGNCVIGS